MTEEIEDAFAQSFDAPHRSPVQPNKLNLDSDFQFERTQRLQKQEGDVTNLFDRDFDRDVHY